MRDLAFLQSPLVSGQSEWMSEESLAYLGQTGRGLSARDLQDGVASEQQDDDLTGLEAYFAKEASKIS